MRILFYILAIVIANVVTASFEPLNMGILLIPWGTLFIGVTFILRDLVQNQYGRTTTYKVIILALAISAASSYLLGDTLWIVIASAIAFIVSETTDTEIYTRLRLPMPWRVFYSGVFGGLFDSVVFVIIGLSPWGANFIPWAAVPMAIVGQVIVKVILQSIGAGVISRIKKGI
ncbi:VUT family protein [Paenibacillus oleatilyticus]|uniref:VUT family protein n=1 Tax=Paenibacillus oleatilyticus TaxID=2594886 RepID=UPI001C20119B|nr:VUT family protein [Paenibacillus oleatilyticus]MBU7316014.1 VUT family protein [Paenibacillus oleatilyticus]